MIYPQESWDQLFYCTFNAINKKKVSEGAVKCHANQPLALRGVEATSPDVDVFWKWKHGLDSP